MYDITEYFECHCYAEEHAIRFSYEEEYNELFLSVFLNQYRPWYHRIWVAIKYVFGYKCRYGHWDTWTLKVEDAGRLRHLADRVILREKNKKEVSDV